MGSNTNYTLVGLFVVVLTAGILGFAYWLAKTGGQEAYAYYQVFMDESVAGLTTDSAVKYRGVDVGTVASMGLARDNPEKVRLLLKIRQNTPITTTTTATLMFYGVTGLAFIELQGSSLGSSPLEAEGEQIPVIAATPSTFTRLDNALSDLATRSTRVLSKIDRLLSDENLVSITALLQDTQGMVRSVQQLSEGISGQLGGVQKLIQKGVTVETDLAHTLKRIDRASGSVEQLARALQQSYVALGDEARQTIEEGSGRVRGLSRELELLIGELRNTVEAFRARPADLLFSRSQPRPGPGEEVQQ
jgi:phospholipid/cholesterol/gamma-HCH transport system substrate-binding protein